MLPLVAHPSSIDPSQGTLDPTRPLGIYVHIPFCHSRCPYCDFATVAVDATDHDRYIQTVLQELELRTVWFPTARAPLVSLYFGGGTPGVLRPELLSKVIQAVTGRYATEASFEITVEANPGDLPADGMARLRDVGVNRISFGTQSFDDRLLQTLGRRHRASDNHAALKAAQLAGFANLCADLMFGLPGQTLEDWQASLTALTEHRPAHITTYALTVEPGTPFGVLLRKGELPRADEDLVATQYQACHERLTALGYEHYEISSYCLPGYRSRHNTLYWQGGAYLGLGLSAASFRPLTDGSGFRFSNPRSLGMYLRETFVPAKVEHRSSEELEDEALWLSLRTIDGVDREAHQSRYGLDPLAIPGRNHAAERCVAARWLEVTPKTLRLTPSGLLFADEVAVRLSRLA